MSKKSMYSEDTLWYDPAVYNAITALSDQYSNAIPVFGGALGAYNHIHSEHPNYEAFIKCLSEVLSNAKFYHWHEDSATTLRRFCRLCFIDPTLIELYIGMSFNELCNNK